MRHASNKAVSCPLFWASERRRENVKWPYVQHQSYKKATNHTDSGDAASHTQMALAHLYSLEASNAHKEKMYIY